LRRKKAQRTHLQVAVGAVVVVVKDLVERWVGDAFLHMSFPFLNSAQIMTHTKVELYIPLYKDDPRMHVSNLR
jgi:hypothetical protein